MAKVVGVILLAVLALYAVLAGADFGGGLWDLLAGGDTGGRAPRKLIADSITPVWESNHVWLIFALVIFWTAFPSAFATVMVVVAAPLWLSVGGIVLRGVGFAFRGEVRTLRWQRVLGATFALASLLTPFFMGTVVGAVATGQVGRHAEHSSLTAWTSGACLLVGCLFVGACAYQAAVFLVVEAARRQDRGLERWFRRRAAVTGAVTGALSLATLAVLHGSDAGLYHGLTHRALPLLVLSAACGVTVLLLLATGRSQGLRVLSAAGVAAVVAGAGVAQYPTLLPGTHLTIAAGAAPHDTLVAVLAVSVLAVVLVVPSLGLLFWLHNRELLDAETN